MKKFYFSLLLIACVAFNNCKAQYATIPDTAFVDWLQNNGFAGCMNGNQLDTACNAVLSATSMSCYAVPIRDLTGIQYFKNLTYLDCSNDSLYFIPAFPSLISHLNCQYNNLSSLPALPDSLSYLNCPYNQLSSLPTLPASLTVLICDYNQLYSLPSLPASLTQLGCGYNQLSSLPTLPASLIQLTSYNNQLSSLPVLPALLTVLSCDYNHLSNLPTLPAALTDLTCTYNHLSSLPALPASLSNLLCNNNQLDSLPVLPASLTQLICHDNLLSSLPALPALLSFLDCEGNQLSSLPALPDSLFELACVGNQLSSLPALPSSLAYLECGINQLNSLPDLPALLTYLACQHNQLNSLPALPDSLYMLDCSNNPNLSCLPELKIIVFFRFDSTAITCLPDYGNITYSNPGLSTLPLCGIFDSGCQSFWNVSGQCYYEQNNNCSFDSGIDVGSNYIKTQLYSAGVLQQQVFSGGEGFYSFNGVNYGNYTVQVDTTNLPFVVSCPGSGDYSVILSAVDSVSYNNNFAFKCRTEGFDIGVQSVLNNWIIPRPAATFTLYTPAGDMSQLYGAHCASGISGQVQIIYSGQLTYSGPAPGALTPTNVTGDTITWNIADFGTVNDFTSFNLVFQINSNATPGSQACFTVNVTPTNGDYNPSNNTGNYCFTIVNALDPNEKEVYPAANIDTSSWLTYTIRFQNTGSAPAVNIRITDSLDNNLDPSTFQLLAYSAKNVTQIFGNDVVFNFPNINLPDSATSDSASRGYIQYKIKLRDGLPVGAQIQNTADIYFDLNPAVVTNTTLNTIALPTGIAQVPEVPVMRLYPNPAKNYVIVETGADALGNSLQITDVTGREVAKFQISSSRFQIQTSNFSSGVYFVKLSTSGGGSVTRKLVVE